MIPGCRTVPNCGGPSVALSFRTAAAHDERPEAPMMLCVLPRLIALIGAGAAVVAFGVFPGQAAVHTVTDLGDSTPGGAPGQLRRLITDAGNGDTINIPAGVIILTGAAGDNANV